MRSFEKHRVLVTGSGRGIGRAIARRFAEGGAKILLVSRSRNELDQTSAELEELTSEVRGGFLELEKGVNRSGFVQRSAGHLLASD